jgi:DNA-binding transcriptional ArsR family regulator
MTTPRRLDAKGLRALAHPLRVRMLSSLRADGPATATQLAARLGESSGTTCWHLRQLAEHGFIEEDPERGTRRDRWWRARRGSTQLTVADFADRPELQGSVEVYLRAIVEQQFGRVADFLSEDWPLEWRDAATMSDFTVRTTAAGLKALNQELFDVIARHRTDEGEELVELQIQSFPRRGAER